MCDNYQKRDSVADSCSSSVAGVEAVKRHTNRLGRTFFFRNRSPSLQGALTLNATAAMSAAAVPTNAMANKQRQMGIINFVHDFCQLCAQFLRFYSEQV